MKFKVKITQVLEGYVEIEAENTHAALTIAEERYVRDGVQLPDMEDAHPLQFRLVPENVVSQDRTKEERVEQYLKGQGHPHPEQAGILQEFLNGAEKQWMYDEAVDNNYSLCDVDRWFNLVRVLGKSVSFQAAMMIDNALWAEDLDLLEINTPGELLNTDKQICKKQMEFLVSVYCKDGTIEPNEFDLKDKDFTVLANILDIPLSVSETQKSSLSSRIKSADSKTASCGSEHSSNVASKEPAR